MRQPLIQLQQVSKHFGPQKVLNEANLSIYQGEVTTIIGKSGVGKSVLLKLIIGLIPTNQGQILYNGVPLTGLTKNDHRDLKKQFSYMFQGLALFDSMNIFDNIALPLVERHTFKAPEIREKVLSKMAQLELNDIEHKFPSQLSGGMQKRVALARALVTDPEIVLFDEPTTGLDPIRKELVHRMIAEYQSKYGFTAVVVSHEIPDVFYISQRVAMLDEGRIIEQGSPAAIEASTNPIVQGFIHGLERKQMEATGMATPQHGEKAFYQELDRLKRYDIRFSIIVLTIKNLSEISHYIQSLEAHKVLNSLAAQVIYRLRTIDSCCRYGLDKLMILLPHTKLEDARKFCNRFAREVRKEAIWGAKSMDDRFCFNISAGFAEATPESKLDDLITEAETNAEMLYEFEVC